jgi:hypothetical protein
VYLEFSVLQCWPSQVATCFLRLAIIIADSTARWFIDWLQYDINNWSYAHWRSSWCFFPYLFASPLLGARWYHFMKVQRLQQKLKVYLKFKVPPKAQVCSVYLTFRLHGQEYCKRRNILPFQFTLRQYSQRLLLTFCLFILPFVWITDILNAQKSRSADVLSDYPTFDRTCGKFSNRRLILPFTV